MLRELTQAGRTRREISQSNQQEDMDTEISQSNQQNIEKEISRGKQNKTQRTADWKSCIQQNTGLELGPAL